MIGVTMFPHPDVGCVQLAQHVQQILEDHADGLPFHGWTHTDFVRMKAAEFARERGADQRLVEAAALVHDLNYVVAPSSSPDAGRTYRGDLLRMHGFTDKDVVRIERIICGAHTAWRQEQVDQETACLSDADTLYKALPITPVLFSHKYLDENEMPLADLAKKIVSEQLDKLSSNYYFYDDELTRRYAPWAKANLRLWSAVLESLDDPDVARLVRQEGH
jgi:uncharacterized protein